VRVHRHLEKPRPLWAQPSPRISDSHSLTRFNSFSSHSLVDTCVHFSVTSCHVTLVIPKMVPENQGLFSDIFNTQTDRDPCPPVAKNDKNNSCHHLNSSNNFICIASQLNKDLDKHNKRRDSSTKHLQTLSI